MNFVFDTDVLIDILRGNEKIIREVKNISQNPNAYFYCSCITIGEVFAGMKPKEEKATRTLLQSLLTIPVDYEIAEIAGKLKYRTKSHALHLDDCLIAATAILNQGILCTKNIKHYPFKKLKIRKMATQQL